MKHLDILHNPSRTGDAIADTRARISAGSRCSVCGPNTTST